MKITILYFAITRERLGLDREQLDVDSPMTVGGLWSLLCDRHGPLGPLRRHLRIAVNGDFASDDLPLGEGDEVALIPPVAGGASTCSLTTDPIDQAAIEARVARDEAGAVVIFRGVVRNHTADRRVSALEYELYPSMALARLDAICDEVRERWPESAVAIEHRHGRLEIGEASVVIAVSSPLRAAAFEACRHAIERIKEDVPIWKKEIGPDGAEWVGFGS